MGAWVKTIFAISILFVPFGSYAVSLQEAIQTAFNENDITQANDLRVDAARDRALAAKLNMLPQGSLSYSQGLNDSQSTTNGITSSNRTDSRGWAVGMNVNLLRGGADMYRAKAAEKNVEAIEATNNSTDALIPDTNGSLANSVFDVYISLVWNAYQTQFFSTKIKNLEIFLIAAKTDEKKNEIKTKIANIENTLFGLKSGLERIGSNYKYLVKKPRPLRIDDFEQMSKSLLIPETSSEAVDIAFLKSPDILREVAALSRERYEQKAQFADSFLPRVDLSIYRGQTRVDGADVLSESIGTSAYVTLSIPFGASQWAYTSATRKEIEAREKDLDNVQDELIFTIRDDLYPNLENAASLGERYKETLAQTNKDVEEIIRKIQNQESVDLSSSLSLMDSQTGQFFVLGENQEQVVRLKFNIQRTIGTLFENIEGSTTVLSSQLLPTNN